MMTPETKTADETLVTMIRAGDSAAFSWLVNRYFATVWAIVYARVGQRQSAEDLVQEVFILAMLHLDGLSDPRRFKGWLIRIAQHRAIDWIRQNKRSSHIVAMIPMSQIGDRPANIESYDAERSMERKATDQAVHDAIFALPEEQREVVLLHFTEGLSKKEIANRLDVHPGTVGRQLTRALNAMRGSLRGIAGEPERILEASGQARTATLAMVAALTTLSIAERASLVAATGGTSALGPAALTTGATKAGLGTFGLGAKTMATIKVSGAVALVAGVLSLTVFAVYKVTADDGIGTISPQPLAQAVTPISADALRKQGWALFLRQRFDEATNKFEQAVKLDPQSTDGLNGLGWSQFNSGQADVAIETFNKAIQIDPSDPPALNGLGWIYFARNQFDKAEPAFLKAAPQAPATWPGLAKIYLLQSKWDDAGKYAKKYIDGGDLQAADLEQANAMLKAAQTHNLPDKLRDEISPATGAVAPEVQQGWMAMNHGNMAKAKQLFQKALADKPNDANALNAMGWLLLRTGEPDEAKKNFENALKNDAAAWGAANGLAIVDRQKDRLDDAIAIWQRMVQNIPGVNAGTYGLAGAYMTKHLYDKAIPLYQQIVDADPTDADAKTQLEKAKAAVGK